MANEKEEPFFTGPSLPRNISADQAGGPVNPRIKEVKSKAVKPKTKNG